MSELPRQAYSWWREAAEKYDYFIAALAAALSGYLGQSLGSADLLTVHGALEALSVACFVGSTILAIKRIEAHVHLLRLQSEQLDLRERHQALHSNDDACWDETGQPLTPAELHALREQNKKKREVVEQRVSTVKPRVVRRGTARDWLLIAGLVLLAAARLLPACTAAYDALQQNLTAGAHEEKSPRGNPQGP